MPSNITDADVFTSPVVVPNDTESATKASLLQAIQPLSNRTNYLKLRMLNALAGGTYTPSAPIIINGSGMTVGTLTAGTFMTTGAATFQDDVTISASLTAGAAYVASLSTGNITSTGSAAFVSVALTGSLSGTHSFTGVKTIASGSTWYMSAGSVFQLNNGSGIIGTIGSSIAIRFGSQIIFETGGISTWQSGSGAQFDDGSTLTVDGGVNLRAPMLRSGTGSINCRRIDGADANTTYSIQQADCIDATITAARTYRLSHTGVANGHVIKVRSSTIYTLIVVDDVSSAVIGVVRGTPTTGQYYDFVDFMYSSTTTAWAACGGQRV